MRWAPPLAGGGLGLLGLLGAGGSGLLLLGLLDGLLASGLTGLGALGAALLDHVEGGTNDGTLGLDNTAGTLLGNFLYSVDRSVICRIHAFRSNHPIVWRHGDSSSCSVSAEQTVFHHIAHNPTYPKSRMPEGGTTDLRDTLAVLATEEDGPCDAAGVLALEEEGLGLAILETEDLAVATDVQLTLKHIEY